LENKQSLEVLIRQINPHGIGTFQDSLEKVQGYLTENKSRYDNDDFDIIVTRDEDHLGSKKKKINLGEYYRNFLNHKRGR
jgi:hypothetical protein